VVAVLALALNNHKPCPACGKRLERHAWKCPYCEKEFGPFPV
jgi:ribosomal protein L37AE/L43A